MISNIYLLEAYNRYVNALKKCYRYGLRPKQVTGPMVLLKNESPPNYTLSMLNGELLAPGQTEFVIPEEVMMADLTVKQNCSIKSKFIITPSEFIALREDVLLCS